MSTVDIDKLSNDVSNGLVYESGHSVIINGYGVFDEDAKTILDLLAAQRTTLKAELLAKMPKDPRKIDQGNEAYNDQAAGFRHGYNLATAQITKLIEEL